MWWYSLLLAISMIKCISEKKSYCSTNLLQQLEVYCVLFGIRSGCRASQARKRIMARGYHMALYQKWVAVLINFAKQLAEISLLRYIVREKRFYIN